MEMTTQELRSRLYEHHPLVQFVFEQDEAPLTRREIDTTWHNKNIIPIPTTGFNPWAKKVFHGRNTYLEKFLCPDAHPLIDDVDSCLNEIFFAVHDYVHVWCIARLLPHFPHCAQPGALAGGAYNRDFAYLLMMSEVVATVSIDFWYLLYADFKQDIGSDCRFTTLTTIMKRTDIDKARTISPGFSVRSPEFLEWLAKAYFHSAFDGFEAASYSTLNEIAPWLMREKWLSGAQRRIGSNWLSYLSGLPCNGEQPIEFELDTERGAAALEEISAELWELFGTARPDRLCADMNWNISLPAMDTSRIDFRYVDLTKLDRRFLPGRDTDFSDNQFFYLAAQYISLFDWSESYGMSGEDFKELTRTKNWAAILEKFGPPPAPVSHDGDLHVLIPS